MTPSSRDDGQGANVMPPLFNPALDSIRDDFLSCTSRKSHAPPPTASAIRFGRRAFSRVTKAIKSNTCLKLASRRSACSPETGRSPVCAIPELGIVGWRQWPADFVTLRYSCCVHATSVVRRDDAGTQHCDPMVAFHTFSWASIQGSKADWRAKAYGKSVLDTSRGRPELGHQDRKGDCIQVGAYLSAFAISYLQVNVSQHSFPPFTSSSFPLILPSLISIVLLLPDQLPYYSIRPRR